MVHLKIYFIILGLLISFIAGIFIDSRVRGEIEKQRVNLRKIVPIMMCSDLAMENSARYIRHLPLSYPGSAFPDYPGQSDYLPSGMAYPPPDFPGIKTRIKISKRFSEEQRQ